MAKLTEKQIIRKAEKTLNHFAEHNIINKLFGFKISQEDNYFVELMLDYCTQIGKTADKITQKELSIIKSELDKEQNRLNQFQRLKNKIIKLKRTKKYSKKKAIMEDIEIYLEIIYDYL